MKTGRKLWLSVMMVVVSIIVFLCLAELLVWIAAPTEYMHPRYQFSNEYGMVPFPNVTMVHGVPRKYKYVYTINSQQTRGEVVEPGASGLPAVVVIGDSYSFGMGVHDGEDFPSVMRRELAGRVDVASIASPGWGLTQEIRRYYERGVAYKPEIVILQFCANDPEDNFSNQVTKVEDGEFVFVNSDNSLNVIKKYLSRSFVQRTQLYNFFRTRASIMATQIAMKRKTQQMEAARPRDAGSDFVPVDQAIHIELLTTFATQLREEGVPLWLVAVDGHLEKFPHVAKAVQDLDARGDLRYLEVRDWMGGIPSHVSPEGHMWDTAAHRRIGEHLAAEVSEELVDSSAATGP